MKKCILMSWMARAESAVKREKSAILRAGVCDHFYLPEAVCFVVV